MEVEEDVDDVGGREAEGRPTRCANNFLNLEAEVAEKSAEGDYWD